MPAVPFIPLIAAGVSGVMSKKAGDKASDSAENIAARSDAMEQQQFEEAKRQADILRQRGDEAAAVQMEEAARAELGAEKFEALSNQYAQKADAGAAKTEQYATNIYNQIQEKAQARQEAGQDAKSAINDAKQEVMNAAGMTAQQMDKALSTATASVNKATTAAQTGMNTAFQNSESRFSPFVNSESQAIGQLGAEMGLSPGEKFTGYRDSPAYMAAQDASRVAEEEGIATIDQAAGNSGSLYSGSRGAALADRSKRGSYERAGIEQSYYQNYMNMLQGMANPAATSTISGMEQNTAQNVGQVGVDSSKYLGDLGMRAAENTSNAYMNAAGTGLNATVTGEGMALDSMRTGAEGSDLLRYTDQGTAGAGMALGGANLGTAGSGGRIDAANTRLNTQANAGGLITGSMPTGNVGTNTRLLGVEAQQAATADMVGGLTEGVSAYLKNTGTTAPTTTATNTGANYNTPYVPPQLPAYMR